MYYIKWQKDNKISSSFATEAVLLEYLQIDSDYMACRMMSGALTGLSSELKNLILPSMSSQPGIVVWTYHNSLAQEPGSAGTGTHGTNRYPSQFKYDRNLILLLSKL